MSLIFEWDESKAQLNVKKHKVAFEEAKSVFNDELAITIGDPDHCGGEDRYVDIGVSLAGRVLVVVYTERGTRNRIISCRKATRAERDAYE